MNRTRIEATGLKNALAQNAEDTEVNKTRLKLAILVKFGHLNHLMDTITLQQNIQETILFKTIAETQELWEIDFGAIPLILIKDGITVDQFNHMRRLIKTITTIMEPILTSQLMT